MMDKLQAKETVARTYLEAVGNKDLDTVMSLLSPDVTFVGPVMSLKGATEVVESLKRISAIHVRNDLKRIFVDADEVCVIYDFVTDTVGSVSTVEWLSLAGCRIQSVRLYYDQLPWQKLRLLLAERSKRAPA
ncbi:MAG TPA: nuclear transport factor 2 family protein [Polyangiaceae bacterium]